MMKKMLFSSSLFRSLKAMALMGCLSLTVSSLSSCDNRNIHQVVKEMAVSQVDTIGWPGRTLETNPFSAVDIDCFADVTYHQTAADSTPVVVLKAPGKVLDNVSVKVVDGDLNITVDRRYKMPEKAVVVVDIYAPFVNRFILVGAKCLRLGKVALTCPLEMMADGNIGVVTSDSISAHEVSLLLEGTGSYDLKGIKTGLVRAKVNGAGRVVLNGTCDRAKMTVLGKGKIDMTQLKCDSVSNKLANGGMLIK